MTTGRKHDPLFSPGTPIPLEDMRAIGDAAMASSLADGLGGPAQSMAGNYLVDPMARVAFWARLTDWQVPYYSFKEVWWDGTQWTDRELGMVGTLNAREFNDEPNIGHGASNGQIVWMIVADAIAESGAPYIFTYQKSIIGPEDAAGSGSGCGSGAQWYTSYQHISEPLYAVGATVPPGALIATILDGTAYGQPGNSHLHFGLGDGQDIGTIVGSGPSAIVSVTGQTYDVADWLPVPYTGSRDPTAAGPARASAFTQQQLLTIRARTQCPVVFPHQWVAVLGSPFHASYEYYCLDLNIPPLYRDNDHDIDVYNACVGSDTATVCVLKQELDNGWVMVLQHTVGTGGCDPVTPTVGSGYGSGTGPVVTNIYNTNFYTWIINYGSNVDYPTGTTSLYVVTNVCPVFETIDFGGSVGTKTLQVGTNVEYRLLTLPPGTTVGAAFCEEDPTDCCDAGTTGSGGGSGSGGSGSGVTCCGGHNGIGTTVTVTFTNVLAFSCADGVTMTLTWNGTRWNGSSVWLCNGMDSITLDLYCTPDPYNEYVWYLNYSFGSGCDGGGTTTVSATSASCPPALSIYFELFLLGACGASANPSTLGVTITL